jgi:hypothetical protein
MSTITPSSLSQLEAQVIHSRCLYLKEKLMKMKWLYQAFANGTPHDQLQTMDKHVKIIEALQLFERELRYLTADKPIFPLPDFSGRHVS